LIPEIILQDSFILSSLLKKTIETITEFLMVIKGNILVLMETVMVLVSLYW